MARRRRATRFFRDADDDDDDDDAMRREYSVDVGGSRGGETGARRCARARLTNQNQNQNQNRCVNRERWLDYAVASAGTAGTADDG